MLKQFLDEKRAKDLARVWDGDQYAVYQQNDTKQVLLIVKIHADSDEDAARLSGGLSEALEKKYATRTNLMRRPNYLSFDSEDGPVFLRCSASDCVTFEGAEKSCVRRTHPLHRLDRKSHRHRRSCTEELVAQAFCLCAVSFSTLPVRF